jgi:hypothetical protein
MLILNGLRALHCWLLVAEEIYRERDAAPQLQATSNKATDSVLRKSIASAMQLPSSPAPQLPSNQQPATSNQQPATSY